MNGGAVGGAALNPPNHLALLGNVGHHHHALPSPAACELKWLPESLACSAVKSIVADFHKRKDILPILPAHLMADVYYQLYRQGRLCQLGYVFCNLDIFCVMLKVVDKRYELHQSFQALLDHGLSLAMVLVTTYCQKAADLTYIKPNVVLMEKYIRHGFELGKFLVEAGWYVAAERCIKSCLSLCQSTSPGAPWSRLRCLECYFWQLQSLNGYCMYKEAETLVNRCERFVEELKSEFDKESLKGEDGRYFNYVQLYAQYSQLYFNINKYELSLQWAMRALKLVDTLTPLKSIVEACRQASKVLIVRRQFKQAELLIRHAVSIAKHNFDGCRKYPGPLLDYGFYLMNVDHTEAAAKMYQISLDYRLAQWGGNNLKVAQAHEDLAYALYVQEYSSGNFARAREHSERAIAILKNLLPDNHLLLASSRRVKALILEEIAIDSADKQTEQLLLQEAEDLHLSALALCKRTFGEDNIQTAKHYGNLGRLYQSMGRLQQAESMHKRAIDIKERLLGPDDYEVALSIGHLASVYCYDMDRYEDAEKLYLRSIDIGKLLFGEAYSGLEYDYRGMVQMYISLERHDKVAEYVHLLHEWKLRRDEQMSSSSPTNLWHSIGQPTDSLIVLTEFFKKYN